mmetsp:Transcript_49097/g.110406  ORF Transcript_49097/g.110406 Transcript_49097/m.110406 type:complete len:87 (+) Transcript_49097:331-591(+)
MGMLGMNTEHESIRALHMNFEHEHEHEHDSNTCIFMLACYDVTVATAGRMHSNHMELAGCVQCAVCCVEDETMPTRTGRSRDMGLP